jgi:LPXTG-site transpeptidase (sortase) family protein
MIRTTIAALGLLLVGCSAPLSAPASAPEVRQSVVAPPQVLESPVAQGTPPIQISIPALKVDSEVMQVGMADDITMEVPKDISVVGWFMHSALPGADAGSTVLVGHRDGRKDPNGVFRHLEQVNRGDLLVVWNESGQRHTYRVHSNELVSRADFPQRAPDLFRLNGAQRIVLLTCGGSYDGAAGGYQANVVVTAYPL